MPFLSAFDLRWTFTNLILSYIPLTYPENLFGNYYEKGDLIARKDMESVEDQDDPLTNANRYVLADITSFFTLLVGIYFPSVTGEKPSSTDLYFLVCHLQNSPLKE